MPPFIASYVAVRRTVVVFFISCVWLFAATAQAHEYALGELHIGHPYSRAAPPTATLGAGYMTLKNQGDQSVRLLGVSVPFAEKVEIHLMSHEQGVMKMQKVEGGLEIPAGETVNLAPGSYHLMFINLRQPLKAGDKHEAVLEFDSGKVRVEFNVEAIDTMHKQGSEQPAHSHSLRQDAFLSYSATCDRMWLAKSPSIAKYTQAIQAPSNTFKHIQTEDAALRK